MKDYYVLFTSDCCATYSQDQHDNLSGQHLALYDAALARLRAGANGLAIGAAVPLSAVERHRQVRRAYPGLAHAIAEISTPPLRNMGTLGGNLCQRNRCWYFRDEHSPCLLRGGNRCSAIEGESVVRGRLPGASAAG